MTTCLLSITCLSAFLTSNNPKSSMVSLYPAAAFRRFITGSQTTVASLRNSGNYFCPSTVALPITTHLDSCTNLPELNQIYARITRFHVLDLHSTPFHWNSLMRPYLRLSRPTIALRIYIQMMRSGVLPDWYTLPIALKAVCQMLALHLGRQLQSVAVRIGLDMNEFCESGLVHIYSKVGDFANAWKVFEQNPDRKLGSWNALIGGFAQVGRAKEAINLFLELRRSGLRPDDVTMVSVASACGSMGDLVLAHQIHKCVYQAKSCAKLDILMSNSLIDMYGKCGQLGLAYKVFAGMAHRNVSSWTSLIVGFAVHGHVADALEFFRRMKESGVQPNHVTFVGVLSACVHGGLVEEGKNYFRAMVAEYGIKPEMAHYGCMVDLLSRAGRLAEAGEVVKTMPMKANAVIWGSLMGACEKFGSIEMGEWVARNLVELEPWNDGIYVVLSNIYANANMWEEVERVRVLMKDRRVAKTPGYSLATASDG